jgi:hypothetical protein
MGGANYFQSEEAYHKVNDLLQTPYYFFKVKNGKGIISKNDGQETEVCPAVFNKHELVLRLINNSGSILPFVHH